MNGVFLNSAITSISRYLVKLEDLVAKKYNGTVDINNEIESLNNHYGFVEDKYLSAFINDIYNMYHFEKNRQLISINAMAYAKYKLDQVSGANDLQRLKNDLDQELSNI